MVNEVGEVDVEVEDVDEIVDVAIGEIDEFDLFDVGSRLMSPTRSTRSYILTRL